MPALKNGLIKLKRLLVAAFDVDSEDEFVPNERQLQILNKLAGWVVRRRLTMPAVMTLESFTPLNYIGSQTLVFFYPFVTAFLSAGDYKEFQQMLEYRDSIKIMVKTIEDEEERWLAEKKNTKNAKSTAQDTTTKE